MTRYQGEANYTHGSAGCIGVLMVNLGTPDAPDVKSVRRYLAEFLSDPRVIETPKLIWQMILHGVILRTRPKKSAAAYQSVWTEEGSPLLTISVRQAEALQKAMDARLNVPVKVALGMRYGNPSIPKALAELRDAGARRVVVLPMYPQYSATTTASVFDAVTAELQTWRWIPELRFINHYQDDPGYIDALVAQIKESFAAFGQPDKLLFSFHGIPKHYFLAGDPYYCEAQQTARLVIDRLGLEDDRWALTFQSRVGPREWLKPYTDHTLKDWGKQGVKSVQVACPGFSADCLETIEEIGEENRDYFLEAGGEDYRYIPALNDTPEHIAALAALVERHMGGWLDALPDDAERNASRERALAMGAER